MFGSHTILGQIQYRPLISIDNGLNFQRHTQHSFEGVYASQNKLYTFSFLFDNEVCFRNGAVVSVGYRYNSACTATVLNSSYITAYYGQVEYDWFYQTITHSFPVHAGYRLQFGKGQQFFEAKAGLSPGLIQNDAFGWHVGATPALFSTPPFIELGSNIESDFSSLLSLSADVAFKFQPFKKDLGFTFGICYSHGLLPSKEYTMVASYNDLDNNIEHFFFNKQVTYNSYLVFQVQWGLPVNFKGGKATLFSGRKKRPSAPPDF